MKKRYWLLLASVICMILAFVPVSRIYDSYQRPPVLEIQCEDFFVAAEGTGVSWRYRTAWLREEMYESSLVHPLDVREMVTLDTLGYPAEGDPVRLWFRTQSAEILSLAWWPAEEQSTGDAEGTAIELSEGNVLPTEGEDRIYALTVRYDEYNFGGTARYVFRVNDR